MTENTIQSLEELQVILDESEKYGTVLEEEEKNVFSLGGRGHYENPVSDLLAFFLNPQEQHKFGDLFLASLFDCLDPSGGKVFTDVQPPSREVYTDTGKRIDILIQSVDGILVIENKIYHWLANPLDDYMNFVDGMKLKDELGKRKLLVVLALAPEPLKFSEIAKNDDWSVFYVTYQQYLKALYTKVGNYFLQANNNKWFVIMREFLLNIERMIKMNQPIEQKNIDFVAKNIQGIYSIQRLWNDFLDYISRKIQSEIIAKENSSVSRNKWDNATALRFYGGNGWDDGANLTVIILNDTGLYRFGIYLPGVQEGEVEKVREHFNSDGKFEEYWDPASKKSFRTLWTKQEDDLKDLNQVFDVARRLVSLMDAYYNKS